jgi:FKBP-type peptidyl-prolyl cis-trans isomerase
LRYSQFIVPDQAWLDVPQIQPPADIAQPPADAVRTEREIDAAFLQSRTISAGTGTARPGPRDTVTVSYTAWTADGRTIDTSSVRAPSRWAIDRLMDGLRLGLQLMVTGEKRRLWIPRELAHEWATGPLVFDVELIDIEPDPDAPTDGALDGPPAGVARTPGGVAYQVLRKGTGPEHPKPASTVTIHYTGWTSDRDVFDASVLRGEPLTVPLDTVIPGLSEGLRRMVTGEKNRLWIPAELAYSPPGPPRSALVVDVELLGIQGASQGQPGTVEVRTNSPDARYDLVHPDGTAVAARGPKRFDGAPPGPYRIKPEKMVSYATGLLASPRSMVLASSGQLVITVTYRAIIR